MGSSKKKKQVVGYDYFMAAIFGLCLKTDKLLKIVYGDRVAWESGHTQVCHATTRRGFCQKRRFLAECQR